MANARFSWKNLIGSGLFGSLLTSKRREIKTRHRKVRRQMFMEQMESRLNLAYSVSLSGNYVHFEGTSGVDSVTITQNGGGYLQHNISLSGNLDSNIDLDSATPGVQSLLADNVYGITAYCYEGNDTFNASTWSGVGITMYGHGGADTLRGGAGNDYIDGGEDNDPYLQGNAGNDTIIGGSGNDGIGTGFTGGSGDDMLYLTGGDRNFNGNAGNDTVVLTDAASVALTDTQITLSGTTLTPSIENYQSITGTDGDDSINASAWTGPGISIYGYGGNDVLRGGAGDDMIDGGIDNDSLYGNGGNDDLRGNLGDDALEGGNGNDYVDWYDYYVNGYAYENGADQLLGGAGDDWIYSTSVDTFQGGADYDRTNLNLVSSVLITDTSITLGAATFNHETEEWYYIYGTENADTIDASAWTGPGIAIYAYGGDDVLRGGAGNDLLMGNAGNDTLEGNDGNDDLRGGEDSDTLDGGAGNDYVDWNEYYTTGADLLRGGAGDDYLSANAFDDFSGGEDYDYAALNEIPVLLLTDTTINLGGATFNHETEVWYNIYGTDDANTLDASAWTGPGITIYGQGGDDTILGSAGNDSLDGGQGSDTVYGNSGDDYLYGGHGSYCPKSCS